MKKFEPIDIDESKLPNVELSDEQKEAIKKNLKANINRFVQGNPGLDLNLSNENLLEIENKLKNRTNATMYTVKNANVFKELLLQAIEKDCPLSKDDILYSAFLYADADCSAIWGNNAFYNQLYISKNMIIIYAIDNYFRIIDTFKLPISDITSVGISYKNSYGLPSKHPILAIRINSGTCPNNSGFYLVDENLSDSSKLEKVKETLIKIGVKECNYEKDWVKEAIIFLSLFFLAIILAYALPALF